VLCRFIKETFEDVVYAPGTILSNDSVEEKYKNQRLDGLSNKSFIIFVDIPDAKDWDIAYIKGFIGGDRLIMRDNKKVANSGEIILMVNKIPELEESMKKRLNVIYFNTCFVENPKRGHEKSQRQDISEELSNCTEALRHLVERSFEPEETGSH